jgi:hypothetical protein
MEVNENGCTQRDANWGAQPPDTGEAFLKIKTGAPRGMRTPDTQVRSLVLYPAELWVHSASILLHLVGFGKAHVTFYTNVRARFARRRTWLHYFLKESSFRVVINLPCPCL